MLEDVITFHIVVFVLLLAIEVGYRIGKKRDQQEADREEGATTVNTFVMTLLSLLLAFSFNATRDRYNQRYELILSESHSIRDAKLSFELFPDPARSNFLSQLGNYVNVRRDYNSTLNNADDPEAKYKEGRVSLTALRKSVMSSLQTPTLKTDARYALEQIETMGERAAERHIVVTTSTSDVVLALLFALSILASILIGRSMNMPRKWQRWHRIVFASVIAATLTVIFDYDSPRAGLIRVDSADVLFTDIARSIETKQ